MRDLMTVVNDVVERVVPHVPGGWGDTYRDHGEEELTLDNGIGYAVQFNVALPASLVAEIRHYAVDARTVPGKRSAQVVARLVEQLTVADPNAA